jgi:hypothetical protein
MLSDHCDSADGWVVWTYFGHVVIFWLFSSCLRNQLIMSN